MIHLTLNTGHAAVLPRDLVRAQTSELLLPLIQSGRGSLPGQGSAFSFQISREPGVSVISFHRGRDPLSISLVCTAEPERHWPIIEQIYLQLSDSNPGLIAATSMPDMPAELPWLATLILPGLGLLSRNDAGFIGHMEACFGLLLIDH